MDSLLIFSLFAYFLLISRAAFGATFTFVNKCESTVYPGILANAGSPTLVTTGFELPPDSTRSFPAPAGWSGRFWARTGCTSSVSGQISCLTGDCGSGEPECNGLGAAPPATLAEFTLGTNGGLDFYDVSLVDGYNLPMIVEPSGGSSGTCASTGCLTDLNRACPTELRFGGGQACKSACEAFGSPEYCCSGVFNSPATCRPSVYSQMFKSACPRSYSYAYDDSTSTFTCSGADYTVTFCPSMQSQKSTKDPTPTTVMSPPGTTGYDGSLPGSSDPTMGGSGSGPGFGFTGSNQDPASGSGSQAMVADGSWLAGLAMGDSPGVHCTSTLHYAVSIGAAFILVLSGLS
ncbi:Pathogenesis-related thaumatin superfamily protein [Striga hermonthica]|uniref:Pathogenesis-related thaumatin superfamily protein n=1 Tax=Striga hermonthica TaxID=68872 RepID=A0A9N7NC48_STRHE|nr:Pathogenesis-related thaumatin superfamily protein [Striga hermonthica]